MISLKAAIRLRSIIGRLACVQVEMEMAHKRQELQGLERQFLTRQFNSEARDRRLMAQSAALHQELDTLRKRLDATHMKAERARRKRLLVQREVHKLKVSVTGVFCSFDLCKEQ